MLNLETLAFDLPEDILKRKWAGDFDGEINLIDAYLDRNIPEILKERLRVERAMAEILPKQYPYSRAQAMNMLRSRVPDFTEADLDELELRSAVDYIYVKGEKFYLRSFLNTLMKVDADFATRAGVEWKDRADELNRVIAEMKQNGEAAYRFRIRESLTIDDDCFEPDTLYRVHLPVPAAAAQQSDIAVTAEGSVAPEDAHQRTAFFERRMTRNESFDVEYSYINRARYVDPLKDAPQAHIYPDVPAPSEDDLSEQYPHIVFTPYLRALAADLKGEETDPVRIASIFYDYVTQRVTYRFMRSYFLIDRHAEYCALNAKGDCGIQALLFITLCRIAGIPARWQSGLSDVADDPGSHDWAQFYVEPFGWLFADPSYGGGAQRVGNEERRRFYFGNLDPFRMVANNRYQTDFIPPKQLDRWDPYDNQEGEVETETKGMFSIRFDTDYTVLSAEKLQ